MTEGEAETKRQKAVEFLHRIGNDELAEKFEAMDAREYAMHKGAELVGNPSSKRRSISMPNGKTKADLESELDDANDYIEELETKLDQIAGIATDEDEDGSDSDGSEQDDDNGGDDDQGD